jgi:hypothetical protein
MEYAARTPIGWANGTSGWDNRWPAVYYASSAPMSTDYDANPAAITDFSDMWHYFVNNTTIGCNLWSSAGFGRSQFPSWLSGTNYVCNSWIYECKTGNPGVPNAGDIVTITISGPFSGSPVTLLHTVTSADAATIAGYGLNDAEGMVAHPIIDDLISKINANSSLSAAGITAATNVTVSTGYYFNQALTGRMYINFNSATVNPLRVTGSFTTSSNCSIYIQPNGDAVNNGAASAALFGRPVGYQCSKTGTSASAGGPSGSAFQTYVADGATEWCFVPEAKSYPLSTPGVKDNGPFPALLQGSFPYVMWAWCGFNVCQTAGIAEALTCTNNLRQEIDAYMASDPNYGNQFNFSIAP